MVEVIELIMCVCVCVRAISSHLIYLRKVQRKIERKINESNDVETTAKKKKNRIGLCKHREKPPHFIANKF